MPVKKKLQTESFHHFISNEMIQSFAKLDKCSVMPKCLKPIADMLRSEHYKQKYMPFTSEVGIYLDEVEIELAKQNKVSRKCTVDFLIGTGEDWILFTEAKFDVKRPRGIDVSELKEKIIHSKELVSNSEMFVHIESNVIVLLKDEYFEQLKRELKNKVNDSLNIVPMNVTQFYQIVFGKPNSHH